MNATINTRKFAREVTEIRAAKTAARAYDPRKAIDAPRGRKGIVLEMAATIRRCRAACAMRRDPLTEAFSARVGRRLAAIYADVIASRGGETSIQGDTGEAPLLVVDRHNGMTLLRAEGWRYYSRRFGSRPATLAYLCGMDDNGRWAVRVPGTCTTVRDAIDVVTPAVVKKALEAGRTVLRQGDVYAVQTTKAHDGKGDLPDRHEWDAETRTLRHLDADNAHADLCIPFPVRFVTQSVMRMGRTSRRGRGD